MTSETSDHQAEEEVSPNEALGSGTEPSPAGARVARSAVGTLAISGLNRLFGAAYQIFLARAFYPFHLGLIGLVEGLTGFTSNLAGLGMLRATIYYQKKEAEYLPTALTIRLLLCAVLYAVLWLAASQLASFYDEPDLAPALRLYGLTLLISSLCFASQLSLSIQLRFPSLALMQGLSLLAGAAATVGLFLEGWGFWSILAGGLLKIAVLALLYISLSPRSLRFGWNSIASKRLLLYGLPVFLTGLIVFLANYADDWTVGKLLDLKVLGVYVICYRWGNRVVLDLAHPIAEVAFPALARVREHPERLRRGYLSLMQTISFIVCPAALGLLAISEPFIQHVLGPRWFQHGGLTAMRLWCLYGIARSIGGVQGELLSAIGRPQLLTWLSLLFLLLALPAGGVAVLMSGQMQAMCWSFLGAVLIIILVGAYLVRRELGVRLRDMGQAILKPLTLSAVMAFTILALQKWLPAGSLWSLGAWILVGITLYAGLSLLLQRSHMVELWRLLRKKNTAQ